MAPQERFAVRLGWGPKRSGVCLNCSAAVEDHAVNRRCACTFALGVVLLSVSPSATAGLTQVRSSLSCGGGRASLRSTLSVFHCVGHNPVAGWMYGSTQHVFSGFSGYLRLLREPTGSFFRLW